MANKPTLPAWFLDAFQQALAQLGWRLLRWEGNTALVAHAQPKAGRSEESHYGLENVYRKTTDVPDEERVPRIVEHLTNLRNVRPLSSLATARERLYPRLRAPVEDETLARELWSV